MGELLGNPGLFGWVGNVELEEVMQKPAISLNQKSAKWKIFLGSNIVVLILFWFYALTDYSWYDNWVSFLYSVLVLCASVITFFMLHFLITFQRVLVFLVCLLTFFMALAAILLHRYHSYDTPVQMEHSPDGTKFISVYCSTDNGHGGMDHIEIIVRNKQAPFLQRDLGLYNNLPSRNCTFDMNSPVRWVDNNTIYVTERETFLSINFIKWEGILREDPGEIGGNK